MTGLFQGNTHCCTTEVILSVKQLVWMWALNRVGEKSERS